MLDARLFGSTPFGSRTAMLDLAGQLELMGRAIAQATFEQTGNTFKTYPLGTPGGPEWLDAIQQQYQAASSALGLPPPPDLQSYDLSQPADFASWTFILGNATRALQIAAGIT